MRHLQTMEQAEAEVNTCHLLTLLLFAKLFSTGYATFASVLRDYILLELPIENALYPFSP